MNYLVVKSLTYPRSGPHRWLGNDHSKGSFSGAPAMRGGGGSGHMENRDVHFTITEYETQHNSSRTESNLLSS